MNANKLQQVWDRQEIEQLMYRHARSLDRMDVELMKSTYWPEAIEELQDTITGQFQWNDKAWKFVPASMEGFKNLTGTQHRISNVLIELDGDKATAETYVMAFNLFTDENGVDRENIVGGRHHFKLEKRNDEWRILHRSSIFDWNQNHESTAVWSTEFDEKHKPKRGDMKDDSYNYIKGEK